MAGNYEALSYAVPVGKAGMRWSRAIPLALLVPLVFAFGTPLFALTLLVAVLAAPALVAAAVVVAARSERSV